MTEGTWSWSRATSPRREAGRTSSGWTGARPRGAIRCTPWWDGAPAYDGRARGPSLTHALPGHARHRVGAGGRALSGGVGSFSPEGAPALGGLELRHRVVGEAQDVVHDDGHAVGHLLAVGLELLDLAPERGHLLAKALRLFSGV